MKKFRCIETGAILLVNNKFTMKQLINNNKYEEVVENIKHVSTEKSINDMNKKELVAYLKALDIEVEKNKKKEDLLALIPKE